jgi:Type I restriction enzyme R protein N terminus (HSDR_N)/SWI2/SNF2 ATPase
VPRAEAERRRGFDPDGATPEERARKASLYFGDLLHSQIRAFNPKYKEAEGALIGEFQRFHADIYGNRDFLQALRNQHKFFCAEENRELDLILIDYGDLARSREQWRNVYEVTEEFYTHNGKYGTREDIVFLINGIPVEPIECKNASKDEAIALGVDQIRRYHAETPEVMVPQMLFTATEAIGFAYGVTWNMVRRNLFNWKHEEVGNLEAKVKSFCAVPHLLRILKDFILFAEKEEELQKVILRQHQAAAVDKVVARALDPRRTRGLVWHTQGSGKTYTMIKAAELLFKAPAAEKPSRCWKRRLPRPGRSWLRLTRRCAMRATKTGESSPNWKNSGYASASLPRKARWSQPRRYASPGSGVMTVGRACVRPMWNAPMMRQNWVARSMRVVCCRTHSRPHRKRPTGRQTCCARMRNGRRHPRNVRRASSRWKRVGARSLSH